MLTVIDSYHDDIFLEGLEVRECIGRSYDKRNLALYRLSNGWLGWLPDSVLATEEHMQGSKFRREGKDD